MKTVDFLQIGFQKCGTTFLENNVYPYNPKIECKEVAGSEMEKILFYQFSLPDNLEYDKESFEKNFKKAFDSMFGKDKHKIKGIMNAAFTFSHERNFDRMTVIDRIYDSFDDVKIIIFIRNQKTWISSHYSQYIKSGGLLRFHDFVECFLYNPYLGGHYIDWYPLINHLYKKFGKERVLVCLYEELKKSPYNLANKIFNFLEVPSVKINSNVVNVSLSRNILGMKRILNHFMRFECGISTYGVFRDLYGAELSKRSILRHKIIYGYTKRYNNNFCYALDKIIGNKKRNKLTENHSKKFKDRYSKNNKKLAKLMNVDLSSYGYI